ncbi:MAG: hypothetical protein HY851_00595 [candidate division Zixibacteria bacterium]|nr:hypothetical protein [candidate division Zixibacteria bacterium]
MTKTGTATTAYIAAIERPIIDQYLGQQGFSKGLILFAVPDYGIVFKCLADGSPVDLEFGAFFALLKFVETSLAAEKISQLHILSSNPEFVFAFTGHSGHLTPGSSREQLLEQHARQLKFDVAYIEPWNNQTRVSVVDFPSVPEGRKVTVKSKLTTGRVVGFKPLQKGIKV